MIYILEVPRHTRLKQEKTNMRTIEMKLYSFDELSPEAQIRAIAWWRNWTEYPWNSENQASFDAFCLQFGVSFTRREAFPSDELVGLRGEELKHALIENGFVSPDLLSGDCPLTGFYMDEALLAPIREFMKNPGQIDARELFQKCAHAFESACESDFKAYFSDESAAENIVVDGYEFTADGEFYG